MCPRPIVGQFMTKRHKPKALRILPVQLMLEYSEKERVAENHTTPVKGYDVPILGEYAELFFDVHQRPTEDLARHFDKQVREAVLAGRVRGRPGLARVERNFRSGMNPASAVQWKLGVFRLDAHAKSRSGLEGNRRGKVTGTDGGVDAFLNERMCCLFDALHRIIRLYRSTIRKLWLR
mmetsp:Transcript_12611/g.31913  ORF Transcript_12611/g.31913 Transcript_12611/m.31913 type:complete len:178 (-) Transcript_12611:1116-1649(-)